MKKRYLGSSEQENELFSLPVGFVDTIENFVEKSDFDKAKTALEKANVKPPYWAVISPD